jgi:anaerobic dimethyl sulfoxide reductase subunit B
VTSYAFTFYASACSGCKTCQEACKEKNNLPVGMLWRRVIEVTGGEWHKVGQAWENSIFAYNLSLACNHCVHPKCAGVCPTDAYNVRPDGIVMIDPSKCIGCGYCAWACPYGAPQYDTAQGIMTKCDFCYDYIDAGLPPSCVAACPLRVLDIGTTEALSELKQQNLWQLPASEHPFPLPDTSRTEPHMAIKPHVGMDAAQAKVIANLEEVIPPGAFEHHQRIAAFHELPLVGFTLLTQAAVGMAVGSLALPTLPLPLLLAIGILLGVGGLTSFLHLGRKRNAWRAVIHLKKSWLSREILMAGLFGATWAATAGVHWLGVGHPNPWPMALLGLGLVYTMGRVYHLRAVASWNSWRTLAAFFLSTLVLGSLGVSLAAPHPRWLIAAGIGMAAELGLMLMAQPGITGTASGLRTALLGMGIVGSLLMAIAPQAKQTWPAILILFVALVAEIIGRWQFYAARLPFPKRCD